MILDPDGNPYVAKDDNPPYKEILGGVLAAGVAGAAAASAITLAKTAVKESGGVGNAISDFFEGAISSDNLRDWRHATHLFIDDNHRLSPKYGFLFHAAFDLGPNIAASIDSNSKLEHGMLVKGFSLPRFTIDTKTLNSYNKPDIVQTKVKYESVEITFHDDSANVILNLWRRYYGYYYRDADGRTTEDVRYKGGNLRYDSVPDANNIKWGYEPEMNSGLALEPFLQNIRLYSLNQRKFTEYTLVRPVVKSLSLGNHSSANNTELMEIKMVVDYETVLYNTGRVSSGKVVNFGTLAEIHYDKGPSPMSTLGGGSNSILGEGGLAETAVDIMDDLGKGDIVSAIFKGAKAGKKFSKENLTRMAIGEIGAIGKDIINNRPINTFAGVSFPNVRDNLTNGIKAVNKGIKSFFGD